MSARTAATYVGMGEMLDLLRPVSAAIIKYSPAPLVRCHAGIGSMHQCRYLHRRHRRGRPQRQQAGQRPAGALRRATASSLMCTTTLFSPYLVVFEDVELMQLLRGD